MKKKDEMEEERKLAQEQNRQPKYKKQKDKDVEYKIDEWLTFSTSFSKLLAKITSDLYEKLIVKEGEMPNPELYMNYKTNEKPLWDTFDNYSVSYQSSNDNTTNESNSGEVDRLFADEEPPEINEPNEQEQQPAIGGLSEMLDNVDNLEGRTFETLGNISDQCTFKFKVYLIKVPSAISSDVNSIIFAIVPIDPNFDITQIIKFIVRGFVTRDKKNMDLGNNQQKQQRQKPNDYLLKSTKYGEDRPFIKDHIFNSGTFYSENLHDSTRNSTIRCPSITDNSPTTLFESLIAFFKLAEIASIYEENEVNEQSHDTNESLKQKFKNLYNMTDVLEKDAAMFNDNMEAVNYLDYRYPLNPNSLFTFENSVKVLNFLERDRLNSNESEKYDIMNFFAYNYFKTTEEQINEISMTTESKSLIVHKKINTIKNPSNGFAIYEYKRPNNVFWMRSVRNKIEGLSTESFPWADIIYAIPQEVLHYAKERGLLETGGGKRKPTKNDESNTSRYVQLFETMEAERDQIDKDGTTKNNSYINHQFSRWTYIPFDPTLHTDSFIPASHLPVGFNHITLHGACLKYRYDFMNNLKPSNCSLFPTDDGGFKHKKIKSDYKIQYIQHVFDNVPVEFTKKISGDKELEKSWNRYKETKLKVLKEKINELNEYAKIKEKYNLQTRLYFNDTFMNSLAGETYRLTTSFKSILAHYLDCTENRPNLITPNTYSTSNGLGEDVFLPNEDLFGNHLENTGRKLTGLVKVQGRQKLKIVLALWSLIVIGHMDMTQPLKLHVMVGGEVAVGKSWILHVLKRLLIPGIAQMYSALSQNALFTTGDHSCHVWISEEAINPMFDKNENSDFVNFFKTLMSDGNLIKMTCDIGTGDRELRKWNSLIRSCLVTVFNKAIEDLHKAIFSRAICYTLGKTKEEESRAKRNAKKRKLSGGATNNKPPTSRFGSTTKMEDIDEKYQKIFSDTTKKINEVIKTLNSSSEIDLINDDDITNVIGMMHMQIGDNQSTINESLIKEELKDIIKKDLEFVVKDEHSKIIKDEECTEMFQKIIFDNNTNDGDESNNTSDKNESKANNSPLSSSEEFIENLKKMKQVPEIYQEMFNDTGIDLTKAHKNSIPIDLFHIDSVSIKRKFKSKKTAFDQPNEAFRTQLEIESEDSYVNYVRLESLVAGLTHGALLDKGLILSNHLFWCIAPKLIDELIGKYPFIKIDNRSIIRLERIAYNLTIIKAFREEFMSPIDPFTGLTNEKHFLPFKELYILDMAPRLFMTVSTITAAFTLISEEFINPWYSEMFKLFFTKFTKYMSFLKLLTYYDVVLSKRKRVKLSDDSDPNEPKDYNMMTDEDVPQQQEPQKDNVSFINFPPLFEDVNDNRSDSPKDKIMNIPAISFAICNDDNGRNYTTSLFKAANFVKYFDDNLQKTVIDMNYISIYDCSSQIHQTGGNRFNNSKFGGSNGDKSSNMDTHTTNVLTNFIQNSNFGDINDIGIPGIRGILTHLLDENIQVARTFEKIPEDQCIDTGAELRRRLELGIPIDTLFMKVRLINEPQIFKVLRICTVKPTATGRAITQLQLCVHSIAKSQSDGYLTSIVRNVINESSLKSIITRLISLGGEYPGIGNNDPNSETYYDCKLDTTILGRSNKLYTENENRQNSSFIIKNAEDEINPNSYMDYKTYQMNTKLGSSNFAKTDDINEEASEENVENSQNATQTSKFNVMTKMMKKLDVITEKIKNLEIRDDNQEQTTKTNNVEVMEDDDDLSSGTGFYSNESEPLEILKMRSLEINKKMYDNYLNNMKAYLPKNKIDIPIDLDEWAAYMHLTTSHCTQLKYVDKNNDSKGGLFYNHKKIPVNNLNNDKIKEDYLKNETNWRPITSLAPSSVAKKLFKHRWNYTHTPKQTEPGTHTVDSNRFSDWKIGVLSKLSKIITAPKIETINKSPFVFYSKVAGTDIPKFILKDLSRLQTVTGHLSSGQKQTVPSSNSSSSNQTNAVNQTNNMEENDMIDENKSKKPCIDTKSILAWLQDEYTHQIPVVTNTHFEIRPCFVCTNAARWTGNIFNSCLTDGCPALNIYTQIGTANVWSIHTRKIRSGGDIIVGCLKRGPQPLRKQCTGTAIFRSFIEGKNLTIKFVQFGSEHKKWCKCNSAIQTIKETETIEKERRDTSSTNIIGENNKNNAHANVIPNPPNTESSEIINTLVLNDTNKPPEKEVILIRPSKKKFIIDDD